MIQNTNTDVSKSDDLYYFKSKFLNLKIFNFKFFDI